MAKCTRCGKSGLFLKLENGLCNDCVTVAQLRREIATLTKQKEGLQREIALYQNRLYNLRHGSNSVTTTSASAQVSSPVPSPVPVPSRSSAPTNARQTYQKWFLCNLDFIRGCRRRFIAFDLETTGLSSWSDKIIELSAVVFENFVPVSEFSTLVNPEIHIPSSASSVNGIYDKDVKDAPCIQDAIADFCDFIGPDALNGDIPMVAHNADFDIKFLLRAFRTCNISANIFLQDTLYMSRWMNKELSHHKLSDVAQHFGIYQQQAHRAADDARVCGEVFSAMLSQREQRLIEKKCQLLPIELEICEWLKSECEAENLNTQLFSVKCAKTFCAIKYVSEVLRIKARGKSPYILLPKDCPLPEGLLVSDVTKSEGEDNIRVHFTKPSDLHPLRNYLVNRYRRTVDHNLSSLNRSVESLQFASETAALDISL